MEQLYYPRYLVTITDTKESFFTNFYLHENHFNKDVGMVIYDLENGLETRDGVTWTKVPIDHL
jgi:hypothetical protein